MNKQTSSGTYLICASFEVLATDLNYRKNYLCIKGPTYNIDTASWRIFVVKSLVWFAFVAEY
jgi:hypothetical protein